jgi:hypothetical protein
MRRHLVKPIWRDAMMEEYQSIMKSDVWDIVPRPEGKSVVTSKWIYKIKHTVDGSIEKHKMKIFSPVARYTSIQMIISITSSMGSRLHQMDVEITFLDGDIEEEVYIKQPDAFVIHEKESHVCRLKMAMYGIKQPPRAWYARIDGHLMSFGLHQKCC